MEKENHEGGEDLLRELNQVKNQIEKERFLSIIKTFELRCNTSVDAHSSHHQLLALTRFSADDNNGRVNKTFSSRLDKPLCHYNGLSCDSNEGSVILDALPKVNLPFIKKLPQSITWVFTNSNMLMAESDSVIGKKQIYYVEDEKGEYSNITEKYEEVEEVEEVEEDEEDKEDEKDEEDKEDKEVVEVEKEKERKKCEFSKDVDRFIWKIGQEYDLDDMAVQSALTKLLKLDVSSDILERYNELKLKNEENVAHVYDLTYESTITTYIVTLDRRFCRRCLTFHCPTHALSQRIIYAREKQSNLPETEDVREQCSEHCYLKLMRLTEADHVVDNDNSISNKKQKNNVVSDTNTETEDCVIIDINEVAKDITEMPMTYEWTPVEKDLYLQGLELFGRNSCLITKNTLPGLKTCLEVYNYMREMDQCNMLLEYEKSADNQVNKETSRKSTKLVRRKASNYAHYPIALKKTVFGENKCLKQYTPCACDSICGDQCSCLTNGNCCEKYCGCSKICNNRFRGCNCAKGQCVNRQCPCFAAYRECDPDLCRSCCLSCGNGSLGETLEQRSQCKNMQFLLKHHKRIILGRSDVQGWGAFIRHSVRKNEYLGEYIGELISQSEANERGKAATQLGSSYLFALNNQLELDARRKGNKFRFLNHSAKPNCFAKSVIVRGDHRIGIYSEKDITEGDELFFDYCYGPGQADWSRGRNRKSIVSKKSR